MVEELVAYSEQMNANLKTLGGLVFSQRMLADLTQAGLARKAANEIVHRNAMAT